MDDKVDVDPVVVLTSVHVDDNVDVDPVVVLT